MVRDEASSGRPENEWFDAKCYSARRDFHSIRNIIQMMRTDIHTLGQEIITTKLNVKRELTLNVKEVSKFAKSRIKTRGNFGQQLNQK